MLTEFYELKTINLNHPGDRRELENFLEKENLSLEMDIDYAVVMTDRDSLIACGCASGNVLKCFAVAEAYKNHGLISRIMSFLRLNAYHKGIATLFLFTKPENEKIFSDLGFYLLASSPEAVLMENSPHGWKNYIQSLSKPKISGRTAALVMNCNPFTLGHRYLIEKACTGFDTVHLFILKEDLSVFSFSDRIKLVRSGTEDLKNLYIHEGKDYIISRATFPEYFLKDKKIMDQTHARLDLNLFAKKIAPSLGITARMVGEEPYCPVTSSYNTLMKEILPSQGITVTEIPRKEVDHLAVSATKVRQALAEGKLELLKNWVPLSTYNFLISEDGAQYGKQIREMKK